MFPTAELKFSTQNLFVVDGSAYDLDYLCGGGDLSEAVARWSCAAKAVADSNKLN